MARSKQAQEWVSTKIGKLVREGKKTEQAVAIALSMARERGMKVGRKPKLPR